MSQSECISCGVMEEVGALHTYLCWLARKLEAAVRRTKWKGFNRLSEEECSLGGNATSS